MVLASIEIFHSGQANGRDRLRTGGESEELLLGRHGERSRAGRDADLVEKQLAERGYNLDDLVEDFLGKGAAAAAIMMPMALEQWMRFRNIAKEVLRISL